MEEETKLRLMAALSIDVLTGECTAAAVTRNFSPDSHVNFAAGLSHTQTDGTVRLSIQRAAARTLCNLAVGGREAVRAALARVGVEKGMCGDPTAEVYLEVLWEEDGDGGEGKEDRRRERRLKNRNGKESNKSRTGVS